MKKIDAVIFDCWDTVIYYRESETYKGIEFLLDVCDNPMGVTKEQLIEDYHELMHEYYLNCNSYDLRFTALFRYICLSHHLTPKFSFEELEKMFSRHMAPTPAKDLDKLLAYLKANGIKVGVCSNTIYSQEQTKAFIDSCWPENTFDFIMASSYYGTKKPNPRFYEVGTLLAQTSKDKTMYVGDNFYADVYGSWLAGYKKSIWLNEKHRPKSDFYKVHPEMPDDIDYLEVSGYAELLDRLKEME